MSNTDREKAWRSLAGRLVRKVNLGWWLQFLTPFLILVSLLVGSTILILRTLRLPVENVWFLAGSGVIVVIVLVAAWMMARCRFLNAEEGLVRLETELSLCNALTAADHGVGQWPKVPREERIEKISRSFEWRWPVVMAPFAVAVVSILAALFIPIPDAEGAADLPPAEPSAWEQMEDMLETLEDQQVIEEEAIEEVRDKIVELRSQPEDDWFSHSSMEATDNLRENLRQQMKSLGAELETAERDLNALQNFAAQMSEEAKDKIMAEYSQALENLGLSGLTLNDELLKKLKGIDPKQLMMMGKFIEALKEMGFTPEDLTDSFVKSMKELDPDALAKAQKENMTPEQLKEMLKEQGFDEKDLTKEVLEKLQNVDPEQLKKAQKMQLTQEEMDKLREQMKQAAEAFKNAQGLGAGKEGKMPEMGEMTPEMQAWLLQMQGTGAGRGGVDRGPGTAPMFFGDETDLKTQNIEQIRNQDLSKAMPGELLGVGETEHDIKEQKIGPKEAGSVKSAGQGGDTVWRESLMPTEKAVLKRYFK